MNGKSLKLISLLLVVFITLGLAAGCSEKEKAGETKNGNTTTTAKASTAVTTTAATTTIDKSPTLVILKWMDSSVNSNFDNYGDTEFAKERERLTGIKAEYITALGQEQVTVLLSSGEYFDVYDFGMSAYPGGAPGMYKDGLSILLNDVKEYAPNYFGFLEANPEIDKMIRSVEEHYYAFPYIFPEATADYGNMIRKDWLDDVGLGIPETVDDYYNALIAFRDQKGADAPLTFAYPNEMLYYARFIVPAFGASNSFFLKDDKVVWGPMQSGYKDYLATLAKWFKEDLIDKDFASLNRTICNNHMIGGNSGLTCSWDTYMGLYNTEGKKLDPNYNLVPCPVPVMNKGDEPMMGYKRDPYSPTTVSMVISAKSKHKELATMFADWNYGEEGTMLNNYGVEGTTYTIKADGTVEYTDYMHNSPIGWSLNFMEGMWNSNYGPQAFIKQLQAFYCRAPKESADVYKQAYNLWLSPNHDKYAVPPIGIMGVTTDEVTRANSLMSEIDTERFEYCYRFILGELEVNDANFEAFVIQMKKLGIEEVLEIYTKGYDLFKSK